MMTESWYRVCKLDEFDDHRGLCALVEGEQVALFKLAGDERVYAIGNYDPLGKANVLSRGIVGDLKDHLVVASPLYKQHFCLDSGKCLEDETVSIPCYHTRVEEGYVWVQSPATGAEC